MDRKPVIRPITGSRFGYVKIEWLTVDDIEKKYPTLFKEISSTYKATRQGKNNEKQT